MKFLRGILVLALVMGVSTAAYALSLTVSAQVSSGYSLGPHALLKCVGYSYDENSDPWAQCTDLGTSTALNFGELTTRLRDSSGADIGGAGCFYAEDFFIVYLYPDAWGGGGYQLSQTAATLPATIRNTVVFTPVYSADDSYLSGGAGQGALTTSEISANPQLGVGVLARYGGDILKAQRGRIVRAEYGIPPTSDPTDPSDTRPFGWEAIPLTATTGTYSAGVTITITSWGG